MEARKLKPRKSLPNLKLVANQPSALAAKVDPAKDLAWLVFVIQALYCTGYLLKVPLLMSLPITIAINWLPIFLIWVAQSWTSALRYYFTSSMLVPAMLLALHSFDSTLFSMNHLLLAGSPVIVLGIGGRFLWRTRKPKKLRVRKA